MIVLRKKLIITEDIHHEFGPAPGRVHRRGAVLSVIKNPFAGGYVADIQAFMEELKPLGLSMAKDLIKALGNNPKLIEGYGKGAIIGADGELEHAALWHAPGGYAMRELLHNCKAIVPSAKKVGGVGAHIDIPITHINASYVRSHFDAMDLYCHDAPRADEILLILAMTTGPRIHSRSGGLLAQDIKGEDGLK